MCGIIGFFNKPGAATLVLDGLSTLKERGKDHFGIASAQEIIKDKDLDGLKDRIPQKARHCIGHNLHSVVADLPQPLRQEGIFAANSEIYNWKELCKKYRIRAGNDSELILKLIEKKGTRSLPKTIEELDGVFAFCYWKGNDVCIARDIIGVKPLWYSADNGFCFASEKKALEGQKTIDELNPREIIHYNIRTKQVKIKKRPFFSTTPALKKSHSHLKEELKGKIQDAIKKRLPEKKIGLLFSGGIDSTFLARSLKDQGIDFTCYTAALEQPGLKSSEDLKSAKKVAKELGLRLRTRTIRLDEVERYLKLVVPQIEDNNVVKVGVALTLYIACEMAKNDRVKVIFSGLGSEEIFAGYERHKNSLDLNSECLSGIRKIYERDLYRDDVITMANNLELRLPYLDRELVGYALRIPNRYKLREGREKLILREIAQDAGIPKEMAERPKKAAQYGSNFDKALLKLSKKAKAKNKSDYLRRFYQKKNLRLAALFSSGKDSTLAMWIMMRQNYEISCLISMQSRNPDSYMWHTPNIRWAKLQAEAMDLPILIQKTEGKKELELKDLKIALKKAKQRYQIEGIVSGAVFSTYQRNRIEKIADELGLKLFSPLWHMDQSLLMEYLLKNSFVFILSSIAADGLDRSWLGTPLTDDHLKRLKAIHRKNHINIAFEGGEAESFVLDAPFFRKKVRIIDSAVDMETPITGRYIIKKAELEEKDKKKK